MNRHWLLFVLGLWMMGTVFIGVVATQNFYAVDRLLDSRPNPAFDAAVEKLGRPVARDLMRYQSSELNRLYFQLWNGAQLLIGAFLCWFVYRMPGAGRAKWGILAMLALVLVMTFGLMPGIIRVGRSLDFVPRDPAPPQLAAFGLLHAAYTGLDLLKLATGIMVILWISRTSPTT